jgi:hypothetical protein
LKSLSFLPAAAAADSLRSGVLVPSLAAPALEAAATAAALDIDVWFFEAALVGVAAPDAGADPASLAADEASFEAAADAAAAAAGLAPPIFKEMVLPTGASANILPGSFSAGAEDCD